LGKGILLADRVAVAELRGNIDPDRQPRQALDQELAHERRVPGGPARDQMELPARAKLLVGDLHLVEEDLPALLRDSSQKGVADRPRLLVDLLQHEMLEARLLRHDRIPGDALDLLADGPALLIRGNDAALG